MSSATQLKLLTLLNVSAIKKPRDLDVPGGHRGSPSLSRTSSPLPTSSKGALELASNGKKAAGSPTTGDDGRPAKRRKGVVFGGEIGPSGSSYKKARTPKGKGKEEEAALEAEEEEVTANTLEEDAESDEEEDGTGQDMFNVHFGAEPPVLSTESVASASQNQWSSSRSTLPGYGKVVEMLPTKGMEANLGSVNNRIVPSVLDRVTEPASSPLTHLGSYKDFYLHSLDGEAEGNEKTLYGEKKEAMRQAIVAHALNHVLKTRRRIVRNNEKLAHLAANPNNTAPDPPRDQSFTRPKVLLLLPLRSLALHYLTTHLFPFAPPGTQIENQRPFANSFSIPADVKDPLAAADASKNFPVDHLVNFKGNSDDNFRIGIKITRKAWRVVMMPANEKKLMECDILIASPLGLKVKSEEERSTDLLSSIEVAVVDGVDVMQMQNWEHVQYIFENMNKIPDSPHGCDFSRVKPWYLDSQAKYLRQTILLSRYDSPEARSLFHKHCFNVQGKLRMEKHDFLGVLGHVRSGVKQIFERIDNEGKIEAVEEVEKRFEWFTKKTLPALQKSAVMRENTLIVIPSYFDFVRVTNFLRKAEDVSYVAVSEYSSNAEISKARTLFFKGKKSFLVVTERFHFYRRYKIRGAKTLVFYSLPDHAAFYAEHLQTPFLPSKSAEGTEVDVDEAEVSSRVLFSKYDMIKLERVVGSENARRMVGTDEGRFEFI